MSIVPNQYIIPTNMDFYFKQTNTGVKFTHNLCVDTKLSELKESINARVYQELGLENYDIVVAGTPQKEQGPPIEYNSIMSLRQKFSENIRHTAFYIRPVGSTDSTGLTDSSRLSGSVQNSLNQSIQGHQGNQGYQVHLSEPVQEDVYVEPIEPINPVNPESNQTTRNNWDYRTYFGLRTLVLRTPGTPGTPGTPRSSGIEDRTNHADCAICLTDTIINSDLRVLPCGHRFCRGCITGWMCSEPINLGRNSCPTCRNSMFNR